MTAKVTVVPIAGPRPVELCWADCQECGWTRPVSGYVTEPTALAYADEHNTEVHGEAAP